MASLSERIRAIREAEGLGRKAFADMTGIPIRTIEGIEQKDRVPSGDVLEKVAQTWPKYAYWLITGLTMPAAGHISPEIEQTRKELQKETRVG